jgi:hypothetical protein
MIDPTLLILLPAAAIFGWVAIDLRRQPAAEAEA